MVKTDLSTFEIKPKIVMLGSGNVAGHLAIILDKIGDVIQVYSPNYDHATELSSLLKNAEPVNEVEKIAENADYYIMAVKDDVIGQLAKEIKIDSGVWAHTSGSVPMSVFEGLKKHYGVFYPLQTFNKRDSVDFDSIPMLIEGSNEASTHKLSILASKITKDVKLTTSKDRAVIHRAAVFACNFANYMWCIADDILKNDGFDFSLFKPLLTATLNNAFESSPYASQTGPARRGDTKVMENHQSLLTNSQAEVYRLLSHQIYERFNNRNDE